ncbi:MAG: hypothetical protein ACFBSG_05280 [Leptolyngbyaceae cyanobacterium]
MTRLVATHGLEARIDRSITGYVTDQGGKQLRPIGSFWNLMQMDAVKQGQLHGHSPEGNQYGRDLLQSRTQLGAL